MDESIGGLFFLVKGNYENRDGLHRKAGAGDEVVLVISA